MPDGRLLLRNVLHRRPWAVIFTDPFAAANVGTPLNVPLHPTQLYEAGAELIILVFLLVTERKGRPFPGRTFWGYMFLYALSRFVIEFYRADERGLIMGLSTSQFISLILAPLSLIMLVYLPAAASTPSPQRPHGARPDSVHRHELLVSPEEAGVRIDRYLTACSPAIRGRRFSGSSKTVKSRLPARRCGRTAWCMRAKRSIVDIPEPASPSPQPEALDLDIVYRTPTSSSSTSPQEWWCILPPDMRRERSSMRCFSR